MNKILVDNWNSKTLPQFNSLIEHLSATLITLLCEKNFTTCELYEYVCKQRQNTHSYSEDFLQKIDELKKMVSGIPYQYRFELSQRILNKIALLQVDFERMEILKEYIDDILNRLLVSKIAEEMGLP